MTSLITILISLLGYGSPADYADYSEAQLQEEIALAEQQSSSETESASSDDGGWDEWDSPDVDGDGPEGSTQEP